MRKTLAYQVVGCIFALATVSTSAQQIKVMQWNVERGLGRISNNTNAQAKAIARIVNFNQPNILLFNEVDKSNNLSVASNEAALIDWVTNNVSYLGTQPGVTFYVKASSASDGFIRNAVVSQFPLLFEGTYTSGNMIRGLHSFQVQLIGTNVLQIFHAHFKCCNDGTDPGSCGERQTNAVFASTTIRNWAATNSLPYIFAGDWNEDQSNPQCDPIDTTYRPITMVRTNGSLVEFIPTALNGVSKTISTRSTLTRRFDYCLAGSNRLSAVSGYVFNSVIWAQYGLYTNSVAGSSTNDSVTASDHCCVFVNYSFPIDIDVSPTNGLASTGIQGGPFSPSGTTSTLTNIAGASVNWRVTKSAAWLDLSATNGTLAVGGSTNIVVSINSTANTLTPSNYTDTINFSNTAISASIPRTANLAVLWAPPVASFTGSPTNGLEPLAVTFTDTSTGNITSRFWDFGDSGTTNITTNSVVHTYAAGNYTVKQIVTGPGGVITNIQPNYITALTTFQSWQIQYFGSTNNPGTASVDDFDGDGQNNMAEFLSGTDPTNSASAFRILSIAREGTNMPVAVRITWAAVGGKTNMVGAACGTCFDDPSSPSYTNDFFDIFGPIIITGSGAVVTNFVDDGSLWGVGINSPAHYYRIRLVP